MLAHVVDLLLSSIEWKCGRGPRSGCAVEFGRRGARRQLFQLRSTDKYRSETRQPKHVRHPLGSCPFFDLLAQVMTVQTHLNRTYGAA